MRNWQLIKQRKKNISKLAQIEKLQFLISQKKQEILINRAKHSTKNIKYLISLLCVLLMDVTSLIPLGEIIIENNCKFMVKKNFGCLNRIYFKRLFICIQIRRKLFANWMENVKENGMWKIL